MSHVSAAFCEALLRMLLAELTREWPCAGAWTGEPMAAGPRPGGNVGEAADEGMSFHRLERDCKRACGVFPAALLTALETGRVFGGLMVTFGRGPKARK